jgi:tetratricopeptide (TPR) repeat protein
MRFMSNQSGIHRGGLLLIVSLFGMGIAFAVWVGWSSDHRPVLDRTTSLPSSLPIPPYSESRFLNAGPEAQYIGSAACAVCHPNNHKSYLRTPHSQALSDLDPKAEPPDGSFEHAASGRSYRVYRKDGQFRHEEVLRTAEGKEIARVDQPIRYLVGSGHFTRSYLIEVEGFLHESPITWYTSKQKWDMSPGYDTPQHWSFERPVALECLACHAGRAEEVAGAFHRLKFHEKAIGCENCHGPGSLHQDLHHTRKLAQGETDLTIVHPAKLSRSLQESICAACHLSNTSVVAVRGREPHEFRPGRPLSDYRIRYQFADSEDRMTVVGHVEQLRQSACYQKSTSLTCVSCHDPHQGEDLKDKSAFYREKCVSCHTRQQCKLELGERLKKEKDNCIACHMPRGDTEIPHIAFTHHRIGRHGTKPAIRSGQVPELLAADDITHLEPLDRQRNLGLAYLGVSRNAEYSTFAKDFRGRATELLEAASKAGLRDPETTLGLVELYSETDPSHAALFAKQILEQNASSNVRTQALAFLSNYDYRAAKYPAAIKSLEELIRLRRIAEDWRLLGMCYLKQNELEMALPTFQHALAIQPYRKSIYAGLAELYRRQGDIKKADECQETARWLYLHRQD